MGWARREDKTLRAMRAGYPRFFIPLLVQQLSEDLNDRFGPPGSQSIILSSQGAALRCRSFMLSNVTHGDAAAQIGCYSLYLDQTSDPGCLSPWAPIHIVWFSEEYLPHAKAFWQHTGEGISSRQAEYCWKFAKGFRVVVEDRILPLSRPTASLKPHNGEVFDDKRFIRNRIASCADPSGKVDLESDVFLYPTGMKAIFDVTRAILRYLHHVTPGPVTVVTYG